MNNLRKFATEAEYSAATLNYPAVSWVVSGDTVHYDKTSGSTPVNDKVIIAAYDGSGEGRMTFFNCEASSSGDITSITLDNVAVNPIVCQDDYYSHDAGQTYIIKYGLNTTTIGDWLSGTLGVGDASTPSKVDILIPSQITSINILPFNLANIVVESEDPTEILYNNSGWDGTGYVYVPDASVNTYKSASGWSNIANYIYPISEYNGVLPI